MPKFAKRFLIALASLAAAIALLILCINLYLQSSGVQQRIRDAVVRALGVDVKIQSTSFTPWDGLVLRHISVPDPLDAGSNFIDAEALRIRFAFLPLFQERFIITECFLFEPRLIIRQIEGGNWMVPLPAKLPTTATTEPKPPEEPGEVKPAHPVFRAELQRFQLNNGYVAFIDLKKRVVLELEKADIDAKIAPDLTATGMVEVSQANVAGYLKPKKINGPFTWNGSVLDLPQLTGSLAGGKINGNYRVVVAQAKPAFTLTMNLQDVILKRLISEAGFDAGKTAGQLRGSLQLAGDPRTSDTTTGKANFELTDAKIKPVEFLSQLGNLLQIEELQLLRLKEAKINLSVRDQKVWVDNMILKSENLALHGSGPIRFNGKMNLAAQLMINQKLQQQLSMIVGKNFTESDDPEYRQLAFSVTGRMENPKTDLLDKLIGVNLGQNMGGLLKSIFQALPASSAKPAKAETTNGN